MQVNKASNKCGIPPILDLRRDAMLKLEVGVTESTGSEKAALRPRNGFLVSPRPSSFRGVVTYVV